MVEIPQVPVVFGDDDDGEFDGRLIQGGRAKWVDKVWTLDGVILNPQDRFLVMETGFSLQRFVDDKPEVIFKEPGKSLPNPDLLNMAIPVAEWPIGKYSGKPEGPWKLVGWAQLLRMHDAARFTFVNSTWGARRCVSSIQKRIRDMCTLRGHPVHPIVQLVSVPLNLKKYPGRFGPEFEVEGWLRLDGGEPERIEPPKPTPQLSKPAETLDRDLNDALPF